MPTTIAPVITNAGVAAATAANGLGLSLQLTHVVLGASAYTPANTQTALVDRREKAAILVGARNGAQVTLSVTHRASDYAGAAYNVGEIGFYAGDPDAGGTLFAVFSEPTRAAPARGGSNAINYTQTYTLLLSSVPTGSVTILYDEAAAVAMAALTVHVQAADPHPGYVRKAGGTMTGPLVLSSDATAAMHPVTLQQLQARDDGVPLGAKMEFMRRTPPPGYLVANGAELLRADYPDLWDNAQDETLVVSNAAWLAGNDSFYSDGNGTTTFRIPDWRADFFRAADDLRGVNAGRQIGSREAQSIQTHTHDIRADNGGYKVGSYTGQVSGTDRGFVYNVQSGATGSAETRPRNVAVLVCIKAGPTTIPAAPPSAPPVVGPPAPPPPPVGAPTAAFTASPLSGNYPLAVDFFDSSTGSPVAWLWNFGDGSTSTEQNPSHDYLSTGLFDVTLKVWNAAGLSSTISKSNYVSVTDGGGAIP